MHDQATKIRFIEMRAQGISFQKISDELGVSKRNLLRWAIEPGISKEIACLKVLEYEAMQERFGVLSSDRHQFTAKWLCDASEELQRRGLKGLSTTKLVAFLNRCEDRAQSVGDGIAIRGLAPSDNKSNNSTNDVLHEREIGTI